MDDKELIKLFYTLRLNQKRFFKEKKSTDLQECKRLEKIADHELELRYNSLFTNF